MLFQTKTNQQGSAILSALVGIAVVAVLAVQISSDLSAQKKIQQSADGSFRLKEVMAVSQKDVVQTLTESLANGCGNVSEASFDESLLLKLYQGDSDDPKIAAVSQRCQKPSMGHAQGKYYFCNQLLSKINNDDDLAGKPIPQTSFIGKYNLTIETFAELVDLSASGSPAAISCDQFSNPTNEVPGFRVYQSFHWYRDTGKGNYKLHRKNMVYYAEKI